MSNDVVVTEADGTIIAPVLTVGILKEVLKAYDDDCEILSAGAKAGIFWNGTLDEEDFYGDLEELEQAEFLCTHQAERRDELREQAKEVSE